MSSLCRRVSHRSSLRPWGWGVLCGLVAAGVVVLLPGPVGGTLAAASVLGGAVLARPGGLRRRRAVVWQEAGW